MLSFFLALSLSWSLLLMSLSFSWAENGQDRELDCLGARKAMTRKPEALKGKISLRQVIRLEKRQREVQKLQDLEELNVGGDVY